MNFNCLLYVCFGTTLVYKMEPAASASITEHLHTSQTLSSTNQMFDSEGDPSNEKMANGSDTEHDYSNVDWDQAIKPEQLVEESNSSAEDRNGLNYTKMHEELVEIRKAQIRDFLMTKLRLDKFPDANSSSLLERFPHYILPKVDEVQHDNGPPMDTYHAKIQSLLRFPEKVPVEKHWLIEDEMVEETLYFPPPPDVSQENLKHATLFVYIEIPDDAETNVVLITVKTNRPTKKNLLLSKHVTMHQKTKWQKVDVTDEYRSWLRSDSKNNLGLVASVIWNGKDITHHEVMNYNSAEKKPFLKLDLSEERNHKKLKRSLDSPPMVCEKSDHELRCCRYSFVLDYSELGPEFNFIISPKRYYANYCAGECPSYHLPSIPITKSSRRNIQRCCTPTHLDSLTLIYKDDQRGITQSELPGMSIASCGCD